MKADTCEVGLVINNENLFILKIGVGISEIVQDSLEIIGFFFGIARVLVFIYDLNVFLVSMWLAPICEVKRVFFLLS